MSGSLKVESKNDRIVEDVKVRYDIKEYDPSFGGGSNSLVTKTSDVGQYLVKTSKDKIVTSVLVKETEAQILANRWSFLLSIATNVIKFKTKLQTARLQVNDVVLIDHEKLFERLGGGKRKYAAISSISKTEGEVTVEADDLGNAFNRVCVITDDDAPDFSDSLDTQKAQNGFITDSYGLIENENYGLNVIW